MSIEQKHFKQLRTLAGLSQQQVADYCKTTRFSVNKAETMGNVKINIVSKISEFYTDYFTSLASYLPLSKQHELYQLIQFNKI